MEILGKKTRTTDVSVTKIIQEIDELTSGVEHTTEENDTSVKH